MQHNEIFENWFDKKAEAFRQRCPNSERVNRHAHEYLPGGDTRTATFYLPYPVYVKEGKGCRFVDIDGNEYIDFLNNYTALTLGHCHPSVVSAITRQAGKGISFASPTRSQIELAEIICERVKSIDKLRFCNSGTEATMSAIRAARIVTGKTKVVKIEGGYHGSHDVVEVSYSPDAAEYGPIEKPNSVPQNKGIPQSILHEVIIIPFNNKKVAEEIIERQASQIACVIVEPMLGATGCICQADGYLEHLRELTRKNHIILIFDEIVTFRLNYHAMQYLYSLEPDLTTFGKLIGGGLPVGAFGGSEEIMNLYSPLNRAHVAHSGTFNGNPVTMAAGKACLTEMTPSVYDHLNKLGDDLRNGLNNSLERAGIKGDVTGYGSLSCIHFNKEEIIDYRSAAKDNLMAMELVHLELLERGINVPARGGECAISSPMTEKEIEAFIVAFEESLLQIRPFIEETAPELLL